MPGSPAAVSSATTALTVREFLKQNRRRAAGRARRRARNRIREGIAGLTQDPGSGRLAVLKIMNLNDIIKRVFTIS
jgi:hypothetical protein